MEEGMGLKHGAALLAGMRSAHTIGEARLDFSKHWTDHNDLEHPASRGPAFDGQRSRISDSIARRMGAVISDQARAGDRAVCARGPGRRSGAADDTEAVAKPRPAVLHREPGGRRWQPRHGHGGARLVLDVE